MDRRYQVFVSSTYRDLLEHRMMVIQSLMQVNAIPVGMELFPAADDDAWTLIRRVIDQSDYYLVIIGGRYGSLDKDGISFTEKEYDYAVETKKPVIAFLHSEPEQISREHTETDPLIWNKLEKFRAKAKVKHCRFWANKEELIIGVLTSYPQLIYSHPTHGWVRGDLIKTPEDLDRLAKLQDRVEQLERENQRLQEQLADEPKVVPASFFTDDPIPGTFRKFLRRLKIEWETECDLDTYRVDELRQMLTDAKYQLTEILVQIDADLNQAIVHALREAILKTKRLSRIETADASKKNIQVGMGGIISDLEVLDNLFHHVFKHREQ
jgi:hypothetical protein